jgi:hypothetical protein
MLTGSLGLTPHDEITKFGLEKFLNFEHKFA